MDNNIVYGRNSVIECITTNRDINKAYILKGATQGSIREIVAKLNEKKVVISYVNKSKLDSMTNGANHQGVVLSVSLVNYVEVDEILEYAEQKNEAPFIIICDGIEDPHNLGAIIRTANIFGVHGVVIKERGGVGITPVVEKTSAGTISHMKIARVKNINNLITKLKKAGLWIVSADMNGEIVYNLDLRGSIALIIGNEGKGVSYLVKENSDFIASIPMKGNIDSLNASVSAGIVAYEIFKQRSL